VARVKEIVSQTLQKYLPWVLQVLRSAMKAPIALVGESAAEDQIKIMPPGFFIDGTERYDLVVNVDSLTEIGRAGADQYWSAIQSRAAKFLSINHEANEFTVAQLIGQAKPVRTSRMPYWMRRGFVEELVEFTG
jgi:hypothetical protein